MTLSITYSANRTASLLGLIGLFVTASVHAENVIVVLKSRDLPQYNAAVTGFLQQWTTQGSAGFQVLTVTCSGDDGAQTHLDVKPTAVVAVGTEATRWAIKNTPGPVVFCMVANAQRNVQTGLNREELDRLSGVSLDIPVKTELQQLRILLPKVKRIGILYDPEKSGAVARELEQAADDFALQVTLQEVASESALPEAVNLLGSRIDLLWAPLDSTVFNSRSARFVLTKMLEHRIPVLGFSENMVKAGALLAPRVNYPSVGSQAARLLQAVLKGDPTIKGAVQSPLTFDFVVNARVLSLMGSPISKQQVQTVSLINED